MRDIGYNIKKLKFGGQGKNRWTKRICQCTLYDRKRKRKTKTKVRNYNKAKSRRNAEVEREE